MLLSDVCCFDDKHPHFWIDAKGMSYKKKGDGLSGIRVTNLDKVVPDYLFYMFQYMNQLGVFKDGVALFNVVLVDRPQTTQEKEKQ